MTSCPAKSNLGSQLDEYGVIKRIASQLIEPLQAGKTDNTPEALDTQGKRALHSNLKTWPRGLPRLAWGVPSACGGWSLIPERIDPRAVRVDPEAQENLLNQLLAKHGWAEMGNRIPIRCFQIDPSIKSSLTFLRKTPWARQKVEDWFIREQWNKHRQTKSAAISWPP